MPAASRRILISSGDGIPYPSGVELVPVRRRRGARHQAGAVRLSGDRPAAEGLLIAKGGPHEERMHFIKSRCRGRTPALRRIVWAAGRCGGGGQGDDRAQEWV